MPRLCRFTPNFPLDFQRTGTEPAPHDKVQRHSLSSRETVYATQ